jgi:general secretion pathway protein B
MSFILDALKKSETDRQRQSGPTLYEVRVAPPRARFPVWAVALGVLLGVNLLALIWFLLRNETSAAKTSNATVQAPAPATPQAPPSIVAPADDRRFNPPPLAPSSAVQSSAAADADAELGALNPGDFEPAVTPEAVTAAGAAPRPSSGRGIPTRDEIVQSGRAQLPETNLSFHMFDALPANRSVIINGQRVKEGETLANGVRIEAITSDGAVLSYQGLRFLVPLS